MITPKLGIRKLNKSISDLQELRKDLKAMDNVAKKELYKLYTFRRNYRPTIEMMERIVEAKAELIQKRKQDKLYEEQEQQDQQQEQSLLELQQQPAMPFNQEEQEEESEPNPQEEQEISIRNE